MEILDTKKGSAVWNMEYDQKLLENLQNESILHLYDWQRPSISYGYFIKPENWLYLDVLEEKGIDLARRPTGGGIVFHLWDLAFSFLMPSSHPFFSKNSLSNYYFVNTLVLQSVERLVNASGSMSLIPQDEEAKFSFSTKFCMARPTKYDVVIGQKKIAGAAQRKKNQGYLHQGTISIVKPDSAILYAVLKDKKIADQIFAHTFLLEQDFKKYLDTRGKLKECLQSVFKEKLS